MQQRDYLMRMNYLKKSFEHFCSILQNKKNILNTSVIPIEIQESEMVARFIFSNKHYNSTNVTFGAFLPRNGVASVMRIDKLNEAEIWRLDKQHVSVNRQSKARGDLTVKDINNCGIKIEAEPIAYARHANLSAYASAKSDERLQAQKLAAACQLVLNPINL